MYTDNGNQNSKDPAKRNFYVPSRMELRMGRRERRYFWGCPGGAAVTVIKIHSMRTKDALEKVIEAYNQEVRCGFRTILRVIHGYGSSLVGGMIRLILGAHPAGHKIRF